MWCVWVLDLLGEDVHLVMEDVSLEDAEAFRSAWYGDDSLVVLLPSGFIVA